MAVVRRLLPAPMGQLGRAPNSAQFALRPERPVQYRKIDPLPVWDSDGLKISVSQSRPRTAFAPTQPSELLVHSVATSAALGPNARATLLQCRKRAVALRTRPYMLRAKSGCIYGALAIENGGHPEDRRHGDETQHCHLPRIAGACFPVSFQACVLGG